MNFQNETYEECEIWFGIGSSMLFSQGVVDALKYSQQDIRGTARYMGMAGAFGALGGGYHDIEPESGRYRSLS